MPTPAAHLPTIWPTIHRHSGGAASAIFTDVTGETCILSESRLNRPVLVLGIHQRAMVLHLRHVRDIHHLTGRWLTTGRLLSDSPDDYQI